MNFDGALTFRARFETCGIVGKGQSRPGILELHFVHDFATQFNPHNLPFSLKRCKFGFRILQDTGIHRQQFILRYKSLGLPNFVGRADRCIQSRDFFLESIDSDVVIVKGFQNVNPFIAFVEDKVRWANLVVCLE